MTKTESDTSPEYQPEGQLSSDDLRRKSMDSFYFFTKAILGYDALVPHLHKGLCDFLQNPNIRKRLVIIPRGCFKTSIGTIAYSIWRAVRNPNTRILIVSSNATNAEKFLRQIKYHFERNNLFRALFPETIPNLSAKNKVKWTETEACINRDGTFGESTFTAIGVGGIVTSNHFDLIIKDDLLDETTNYDGTPLQTIIDFHRYSYGLYDNPSSGEDLVIGTRYHFNDLYQYILDNEPHYKTFIRSAIEDGRPVFPEKYDLQTLSEIKASQGPELFSCQYLNSPIDESAIKFRKEHLQPVQPADVPVDIRKFMMTDTIGDSQGKDYFATVCWGVEQKVDHLGLSNLYLLDIVAGRLSIEEAIQAFVRMYMRQIPLAAGIEREGQSTFALHVQNFLRGKATYLRIDQLTTKGRSKETRIMGLLPYALNRKVFVSTDLLHLPDYQEFEYEWLRFPKLTRDDVLDASAYLLDFMAQYPVPEYIDHDDNEYAESFMSGKKKSAYA